MTQLGNDTFTRANQTGLGTASDGQTWAQKSGTGTVTITSNEGTSASNTANAVFWLGSNQPSDCEVVARFNSGNVSGDSFGVLLRSTAAGTWYAAMWRSAASNFVIRSNIGGVQATVAASSPTFTASNNTWYWIRLKIIGTTLFAKIWQDGTAEPAVWNVNAATDTNIASGHLGLLLNAVTATAVQFDSFYCVDYSMLDSLAAVDVGTYAQDTAGGLVESVGARDGAVYTQTYTPPTASLAVVEAVTYATVFTPVDVIAALDSAAYACACAYAEALAIQEVLGVTQTFAPIEASFIGVDTFVRANQSGWGTASDGQTWAELIGTALTESIVSNQGTATGSNATTRMVLGSSTPLDINEVVQFSVTSTNDSVGLYLRSNKVGNNVTEYHAVITTNGTKLAIIFGKSGTPTTLQSVTIPTIVVGTQYFMRFQALGSELKAKLWQSGTTEPDWMLDVTDTNIVTSGAYGIYINLNSAGDTASFSQFSALGYTQAAQVTASDAASYATIYAPVEATPALDTPLATLVLSALEPLAVFDTASYVQAFNAVEATPALDTLLATLVLSALEPLAALDAALYAVVLAPVENIAAHESAAYAQVYSAPVEALAARSFASYTLAAFFNDALAVFDVPTNYWVFSNLLTAQDAVSYAITYAPVEALAARDVLLATLAYSAPVEALAVRESTLYAVVLVAIEALAAIDQFTASMQEFALVVMRVRAGALTMQTRTGDVQMKTRAGEVTMTLRGN